MSQIPIEVVSYDPSWPAKFAAEKPKLLQALGGWVTDLGAVYAFALEHIGSTSIPGLWAKPCIDIAIGVHPFPLGQEQIQALEGLGYTYRGENGIPGREYFQRGSHDFHLHIFAAGDWRLDDHRVFRDYLKANPGARQRYQTLKLDLAQQFRHDRVAYTLGKAELVRQLLQEGHAWHVQKTAWSPLEFVQAELEGLGIPWMVSSGWALDLHVGKPQRLHQDFDVLVWREDQQAILGHLRARGWRLSVPVEGRYRPQVEGEYLELPSVQVHCYRDDMEFDMLDILFAEREGSEWVWRRNREVRMPVEQVALGQNVIRYLNPAIVLLFKSRSGSQYPRDKDSSDFERAWPYLSLEQRQWLRESLIKHQPEHPWLERL